jgi:hypothetical protein
MRWADNITVICEPIGMTFLKMKTTCFNFCSEERSNSSPEKFVPIYQTTRCHSLECPRTISLYLKMEAAGSSQTAAFKQHGVTLQGNRNIVKANIAS